MIPGGSTVAQWLEQRMSSIVGEFWDQYPPEEAIARAFSAADRKLLQVPGGFFGAFGGRLNVPSWHNASSSF